MKFLLAAMVLVMTTAAFADSKDKAIDAFNDSKDVKNAIRSTRLDKTGGEEAILLKRLESGCEIFESYLVVQKLEAKVTRFRSTVAARVEVRILDKTCTGEGHDKDIDAKVRNLVDLEAVTRIVLRD